ncbi:unnamed protein product [Cladocopium goreaui]|uniref:Uncharacterized protein n=1 Tax=Cladocopium goreaui TaxID=2562237 RepID=A0A9P1BKG6_9DINO|nr:unnamed protein product [Cladocopium goreaui]
MDTVDTLPMVEDVALPGPFVPSENAEDMVSALPQSATESGKVEVEVEVSNGEVQFLDPQGKNEVEVSNGEAQGHPKQSTEVEVNKDKTKSLETSHVNTEAKNEQLENLLQPGHASEPCGSSPSSEPPAPATLELDPQTSQPDKSPAKTPPNQTSHEGKVENSHVLPPGEHADGKATTPTATPNAPAGDTSNAGKKRKAKKAEGNEEDVPAETTSDAGKKRKANKEEGNEEGVPPEATSNAGKKRKAKKEDGNGVGVPPEATSNAGKKRKAKKEDGNGVGVPPEATSNAGKERKAKKKDGNEEGVPAGDTSNAGKKRKAKKEDGREEGAPAEATSNPGKKGKAKKEDEGQEQVSKKRLRKVDQDPREALRSKKCSAYSKVLYALRKQGVPEEDAKKQASLAPLLQYSSFFKGPHMTAKKYHHPLLFFFRIVIFQLPGSFGFSSILTCFDMMCMLVCLPVSRTCCILFLEHAVYMRRVLGAKAYAAVTA